MKFATKPALATRDPRACVVTNLSPNELIIILQDSLFCNTSGALMQPLNVLEGVLAEFGTKPANEDGP